MIFETPTQFAILALCFVAGWLFGLASAPGGRRAKDRLHTLETEHAAYRRDAEARIAAAEAERDRLARATPVATATTAAVAGTAARPASSGFFGWGRDNLSRIHGLDEATEKRINAEGITTYQQIETMSGQDEADLEQRLGLTQGTIQREGWREQAAMLREGHDDDHRTRFTR